MSGATTADGDGHGILQIARRLADDVLFPTAAGIDAADAVPRSRLDLFADAGLYGAGRFRRTRRPRRITDDRPGIAPARAAAADLALRVAAALVVDSGSRAALRHEHPDRLAREALFLLVFGTRPPIRAALLARFGIQAGIIS